MYRSLLTSQFLQRELNINPEVWVDLHEVKGCRIANQAFPGLARSQIIEKFPGFALSEEVTEQGWFRLDRAETEEEGWARAGRVWDRLKRMSHEEKYQGKSILIVTHGLFLDFLIGKLCNREMKGGKS
jgi:broad specificity phosphatase PhoE